MSLCAFKGASGKYYDYSSLDLKNRAAFPLGGGNYVFTRLAGDTLEVICAGETDNMWSVFVSTKLWQTAKKEYGATLPFIHPNPDRMVRELESLDIIRMYRPPMNEALLQQEGPQDAA